MLIIINRLESRIVITTIEVVRVIDTFDWATCQKLGIELNIYLFHDGNGENPSLMNAELLKEKSDVLSVPLADILKDENYDPNNSLHLSITLYELTSDKKEVKKNTYHLNGN